MKQNKKKKKDYKYQKSRDKNILFATDNIIFYWDSWQILELIRAFSNAIQDQQKKTGGFEDKELRTYIVRNATLYRRT